MTNYAQFTGQLQQLQKDLRDLSNKTNNPDAKQFIERLGSLADFLSVASEQQQPFAYAKSAKGIANITPVVYQLSHYLTIDIQYPTINPFAKEKKELKINGVGIKEDFTIVDDTMYQAIVAFKSVINTISAQIESDFSEKVNPHLTGEMKGDFLKKMDYYFSNERDDAFYQQIGDNFYDEIGQIGIHLITDFNKNVSSKMKAYLLKKKASESGRDFAIVQQTVSRLEDQLQILREEHDGVAQAFQEKYNLVSRIINELGEESSSDDVNTANQLLIDFINKQEQAVNDFNKKHSLLIEEYAEWVDEWQEQKIDIFYFETDDLLKALNTHKQRIVLDEALTTNSSFSLDVDDEFGEFVGYTTAPVETNSDDNLEFLTVISSQSLTSNESPVTTQETQRLDSDERFDLESVYSEPIELPVDFLTPPAEPVMTVASLTIAEAREQVFTIQGKIDGFQAKKEQLSKGIQDNHELINRLACGEKNSSADLESQKDILKYKIEELTLLIKGVNHILSSIDKSDAYVSINKTQLRNIKSELNENSDLVEQFDKVIGEPRLNALQDMKKSVIGQDRNKIKQLMADIRQYFKDNKKTLSTELAAVSVDIQNVENEITKATKHFQNLSKKIDKCTHQIEKQQVALTHAQQTLDELVQAEEQAQRRRAQEEINTQIHQQAESVRYNELTSFYHKLMTTQSKFRQAYEQLTVLDEFNQQYQEYEENQAQFEKQSTDTQRIKATIDDIHELKTQLEAQFKEKLVEEASFRINDPTKKTTDNDKRALEAFKKSRSTLFKHHYPIKKVAPLEICILNKNFFGEEGTFTEYKKAVQGCASSLLEVIYTCLACVSFGCFNYQTEFRFLDELEKTNEIENKLAKIEQRLKDYSATPLSEKLRSYQTELTRIQQEMAAAVSTPGTSSIDDSPTATS